MEPSLSSPASGGELSPIWFCGPTQRFIKSRKFSKVPRQFGRCTHAVGARFPGQEAPGLVEKGGQLIALPLANKAKLTRSHSTIADDIVKSKTPAQGHVGPACCDRAAQPLRDFRRNLILLGLSMHKSHTLLRDRFVSGNVSLGPIATGEALTASRRFRGIADITGLPACRPSRDLHTGTTGRRRQKKNPPRPDRDRR